MNMNAYTCCICLKSFTPREVVEPTQRGCPDVPMICKKCRRHPEALDVARQLLKQHLEDHRKIGDFRATLSNAWRDPWRGGAYVGGVQ